MDKDYISTGSGYYQKVSDGSGPYIKQAKDDYTIADLAVRLEALEGA